MRGLRILLLGRPRLELDGQPLTRLIPLKQQALVFYLAVQGTPVSRGELATLLWEELSETAARANLRVALTRLRRWLPNLLDIDAHQVGFVDGAPLAIDVADLGSALQPARPHDFRVAAARAWRGPLLEGFALDGSESFEHWIAIARQRAQRDAVALRHDLAAHARQAGHSEEALEHLRALLEIDDTDEDAHMASMEVLSGMGQRTAAIAQYEACRAAMAERLGARPSAKCYALYVQIHAQAPAPAEPLPSPGAAPLQARAPAVGRLPDALPTIDATPLVGRSAEVALLGVRLADAQCRWLTITGPGGVGKTRLARATADTFGSRFRHGVLWLSGRESGGPLRDAEALSQHVLERVGSDCDAAGALLLVLDDLETAGCGREMAQALQACAQGVSVLATSRRRLGGSREWLLELPGLSLAPDADGRPGSSPAACLLAQAARRLDPGFDLDAQGDDADRLCHLVGGLPLALSLAARSLQRIGLRGVIERLQAGELPAETSTEASDPHHHSLGVVLEESWTVLDGNARAAALRLAWLPCSFDMALATAIGAPSRDVETLREHSWLSLDDQGCLALHPLQQDDLRRRAQDTPLPTQVHQALVAYTLGALPAIAPFGDWPAGATSAATIGARPAFGPSALVGAMDHLLTTDLREDFGQWVDGVAALLLASRRASEAAALLARAARRDDLPEWRTAGWMLRQGETLNALGDGEGARRVFESALSRMGINPLPRDEGTAQGLARSMWRTWSMRGWPSHPDDRLAFSRLLLRSVMFLGQQHTFAPQHLAAARTLALGSALTVHAGHKAERLATRISNSYGAALFGFPVLARTMSHGLAHRPRIRDDAHLDAFIDHTLCALQVALGQWEGLAPRIEAIAEVFVRYGDHRHEMECHSLVGKLLFYQGQLHASAARFALCHERGLQLPAGAYRAVGPFGMAEAGLCLGNLPLAELQRLADTGSHWLTEMENMDNAYTLRRLGLLARLAWRAGDVAQARETVMAGVAAAARLKRCGFWAHEGYSGIGEGLVRLRRHEREIGGSLPPLDRAWATYQRALEGHVGRFPPARAMLHRLLGQALLEQGSTAQSRRHLTRAVRDSEVLGMRVELARSCDALAQMEAAAHWDDRARRVWADMRRMR